MQNTSRVLYNQYLTQLATLNGVSVADLATKFAIAPAVEQRLESKIQDSSDFLKKINFYGVTQQEGEKIGMGVGGTIAGSTDTTQADRQTRDVQALASIRYRTEQTNFDTHIRYATIDAWAAFPDFQTRLRDSIVRRIALDRMMIGFNGTSRAATSNRAQNPLLQDVNTGWLEKFRTEAPQRCMGIDATHPVEVGVGKAYSNLDAVVFDATKHLLDPWYTDDPALVVICGRDLINTKYFPIINSADNQTNVNRVAADMIISAQRIGGLAAVGVPYFPSNALMVTRLDNLSIYWQQGTRRRTVLDNAKRDRIENYESVNEAYVVEDFGAGALVQNIRLS